MIQVGSNVSRLSTCSETSRAAVIFQGFGRAHQTPLACRETVRSRVPLYVAQAEIPSWMFYQGLMQQ